MDLRVRLPKPVAAEIEEVQRRDPDMLSRILFYAVTRHAFFHHLAGQMDLIDAGRAPGDPGSEA